MTSLERFRAAFTFQKLDRLPILTFGGWPETYIRWANEGLPGNWRQTNYFGEDKSAGTGVHLGTNGFSPFFPRFVEELIEENNTYRIVRDEHARLVKHKKGEVNESISEYLEFPMKAPSDWEQMRGRLDPSVDVRFEHLAENAARHETPGRDYPVMQNLSGTFRMLWHLLGDINMAYIFYDTPELVHKIMNQWLHMNVTAVDRIMKVLRINLFNVMEDMSCNTGMMISPALFREFMMPYYKEFIQHVKSYDSVFGVWVDSDGDVSELIPLLIECGVDGLFPFEVQAGMDVTALREQYGDRLVIRGGIDKRELPKGRDAIDRELERVLPIFVETGGYFICLDHQAPPDVSLENYLYFLEKARSYG